MKNAKKTTNTVNARKISYGNISKDDLTFENAKEFAVNGGKNGFSLNDSNTQGASNNDARKSKQNPKEQFQNELADSNYIRKSKNTHTAKYHKVTGGNKSKGNEKIDIELK